MAFLVWSSVRQIKAGRVVMDAAGYRSSGMSACVAGHCGRSLPLASLAGLVLINSCLWRLRRDLFPLALHQRNSRLRHRADIPILVPEVGS